jgi:hypothetical protein
MPLAGCVTDPADERMHTTFRHGDTLLTVTQSEVSGLDGDMRGYCRRLATWARIAA